MSTVAEILTAAEKLATSERNELIVRLLAMEAGSAPEEQKPYTLVPLPLGIRTGKLPSHVLEEFEEEEFARRREE